MTTSFAIITDTRLARDSMMTLMQGIPLACDLDWKSGRLGVDVDVFDKENPHAVWFDLVTFKDYHQIDQGVRSQWESAVGRKGSAVQVSFAMPSRLTGAIIHHVATQIWAIDKRCRVLVYSFADNAMFTPQAVDWDALYDQLVYEQGA